MSAAERRPGRTWPAPVRSLVLVLIAGFACYVGAYALLRTTGAFTRFERFDTDWPYDIERPHALATHRDPWRSWGERPQQDALAALYLPLRILEEQAWERYDRWRHPGWYADGE